MWISHFTHSPHLSVSRSVRVSCNLTVFYEEKWKNVCSRKQQASKKNLQWIWNFFFFVVCFLLVQVLKCSINNSDVVVHLSVVCALCFRLDVGENMIESKLCRVNINNGWWRLGRRHRQQWKIPMMKIVRVCWDAAHFTPTTRDYVEWAH